MSRIPVLLVDDHEMVRYGLRALLRRHEDIEVVGEAGSVAQALDEAARLKPAVILMDLRLPDASGVDACREILAAAADDTKPRVIFLTSYPDEDAVVSTLLAGAVGYLLKDISHEALAGAIRDAAAGRSIIDPRVTQPVARGLEQSAALSRQERRILSLVVKGRTNKEIGIDMGLSDRTVRNYLSNAFQKLGVTRRSEAAAAFLRSPPPSE